MGMGQKHEQHIPDELARMRGRAAEILAEAESVVSDSAMAEDVRGAARSACGGAMIADMAAQTGRHDFDAARAMVFAEKGLGALRERRMKPDAAIGSNQRRAAYNGHRAAYGTPEERAARDAKLAKAFDYCFAECGKKEKAYRAVARANNCSDRLVREAVKKNKRT